MILGICLRQTCNYKVHDRSLSGDSPVFLTSSTYFLLHCFCLLQLCSNGTSCNLKEVYFSKHFCSVSTTRNGTLGTMEKIFFSQGSSSYRDSSPGHNSVVVCECYLMLKETWLHFKRCLAFLFTTDGSSRPRDNSVLDTVQFLLQNNFINLKTRGLQHFVASELHKLVSRKGSS